MSWLLGSRSSHPVSAALPLWPTESFPCRGQWHSKCNQSALTASPAQLGPHHRLSSPVLHGSVCTRSHLYVGARTQSHGCTRIHARTQAGTLIPLTTVNHLLFPVGHPAPPPAPSIRLPAPPPTPHPPADWGIQPTQGPPTPSFCSALLRHPWCPRTLPGSQWEVLTLLTFCFLTFTLPFFFPGLQTQSLAMEPPSKDAKAGS